MSFKNKQANKQQLLLLLKVVGRSCTARLECSTEACGGRLLWFCCKIYFFSTQ